MNISRYLFVKVPFQQSVGLVHHEVFDVFEGEGVTAL